MFNIKKILTKILNLDYYVSELDGYLAELDQRFPHLSASQKIEIERHQKIAYLRDHPQEEKPTTNLWEKF